MEYVIDKQEKEPLMRDVFRAGFQPGYTWLDMERATNGRAFEESDGLGTKIMAYTVVGMSEIVKVAYIGGSIYEGLQNIL